MKELILNGKTTLGIELGSTRIKTVLSCFDGTVLAVDCINGGKDECEHTN